MLLAIVCLIIAAGVGLAGNTGPADAGMPARFAERSGPGGLQKVEQRVLRDTENGNTTQFIVLMKDQADLSAAYGMKDQDARGWFVYNALKAQADKSQAPIRVMLAQAGSSYTSYWVANALLVTGGRDVVDGLAARADVRSIESNNTFKGFDDPTAPVSTEGASPLTTEWGVQNVNAPQVWTMGFTGQGIVIGNQDTGMRWTHNALKPKYRGWNGTTADHNYNWYDGVRGPVSGHTTNPCGYAIAAPCDDQGHGTHTTGTTVGDDGAGNQVGVAPGARWIGCRNMDAGDGRPSTYMNCFQFFVAPTDVNGNNPNPALRPHVMNNSWGCPTSETCAADTLRSSVESAQASGVFVEVSAGNSGSACGSVTDPPAIYGSAFSTGAMDISNTIASFSSRGPVTVDGSNRMKPNITAPGVNVRSTYYSSDTSYTSLSGTSMAGPHVVGVVALLWSAHPELSRMITETRQLLQNTANPLVISSPQTCGGIPSSQIPNNTFGYGRVDALAAVNGAATIPTATPTAAAPTATRTSTAVATAVATSTATPGTSTLTGHVSLQGRGTPPNALWSVPVTVTLRSTSGPGGGDFSATTDSSGYFTLTVGLAPGSYNWRTKNPQTLANQGGLTLSSGTTSVEMGLLQTGDANNDNCVNATDFGLLKNTFGKSPGDPGYDARADFTGDGSINVADFNLVRANFGFCGAAPISPAR